MSGFPGDGFGRFRDNLTGLELPELDLLRLEMALSVVEGSLRRLEAAHSAAVGANGPEIQLFRILELITEAGTARENLAGALRWLQGAYDTCRELEKSARIILGAAMADTGAPAITSGRYTADPQEGSQRVEVDEPALIPSAFLRFPEPEPDKAAIRAALLKGETVPGARLVTGRPSVRITAQEARE